MNKITYTTAFSKILDEWIKPEKRIIIVQGGTSASKTYSILQLIDEIAIRQKKNKLISITSESFPHLHRGAEKDYFKIIENEYNPRNHNKTNHSYRRRKCEIEFFSCDDASKVHGPRRDYLFVNEANNVYKETFSHMEIRTLEKIIIDFNPVCEFWAHEMISRDDVSFVKLTPYDNECLDKRIFESIMKRAEIDPDFKRVYVDGEIGSGKGLIFQKIELIETYPEEIEKERIGLDFGFSNHPSAAIRTGIYDDSIYLDELFYETGLTSNMINDELLKSGVKKEHDKIIGDCADPRLIEELSILDWWIEGCYKGSDSIRGGIDKMKCYKIKITKRSLNLIKEFRNYTWAYDKMRDKYLDKPVDDWNHGIDAARYAVIDMHEPEGTLWSVEI